MIDIFDYKSAGGYRIRARVKYYYDETPRWDWKRHVEQAEARYARGSRLRGARDEHQVMAYLASPSTDVYIDRLPLTARENFWKLVEWAKTEEATVYTELDGIGYIAPHRNKKLNEHIFVVHGGKHSRMHRDVTRETIELHRVPPKDLEAMFDFARRRWELVAKGTQVWGVNPAHTFEEHMESEAVNFLRQRTYRTRTVYLDRLTKKELDKLALLKLMPEGKFLEGHGGKFINWGAPHYVLLGDK